jgi:hypothetical protein
MKKIYSGTVYIGTVGSELEHGQCHDSMMQMTKRPGDVMQSIRATKGFEARQQHFDNFMASGADFLLLMDADMIFPENTLEKLRSHGLPYVSGIYMRRMYAPIAPIWFQPAPRGVMPLKWWTGQIAPSTLYPIGASGWGCVLIHRDVVLAVRQLLKGEADVIEDDMDVYPYDLARIMRAVKSLRKSVDNFDQGSEIAIDAAVTILEEEVRPLRALKTNVGSDVRYPFFAKLAGYQLMGDSGAPCGHMLNYPLKPSDYMGMLPDYTPEMTADLTKAAGKAWAAEKARIDDAKAAM